MYRHRKKCQTLVAINNYSDTVRELALSKTRIETLEETNQELTDRLEKMMAENEKMTIENKKLSDRLIDTLEDERQVKNKHADKTVDIISGAGNIIGNQSKTLLNLLRKHANDAPTLSYWIDDDDMTEQIKGNDNNEIGMVLVNHHKDGNLHSVLGDVIVVGYQEDNVKQQSLWSTDVARLTYLVKEIGKKGSLWTQDKKGNKVKRLVIKPLLKKIKTIVEAFNNAILKTPMTEMRLKIEREISQLIHEIGYKNGKNTSELADKINKYVAGHMHFDEKNKSKLV